MCCILFAAGLEPKLDGEAIFGGIKVVRDLLKTGFNIVRSLVLENVGCGGEGKGGDDQDLDIVDCVGKLVLVRKNRIFADGRGRIELVQPAVVYWCTSI